MELSGLTAISPVDGRYGSKTKELRAIFSEFGLIKYRVIVEVRWLQALSSNDKITEVANFSDQANLVLSNIIENFSEADAQRVKDIERALPNILLAIKTGCSLELWDTLNKGIEGIFQLFLIQNQIVQHQKYLINHRGCYPLNHQ